MFLLVNHVNNIFVFLVGFYCLLLMLDLVRDKIHKMSTMFGHMSNLALQHFFLGPMLSITFVP